MTVNSAPKRSQSEELQDWCRFVKASATSFKLNALKAVLENAGEQMLIAVLKHFGWQDSVALIKAAEAPELK